MPRGRAVWKGRLTFGLVGIPVELVPAIDSQEHVGFHLVHRKDRAPIEYRKFCSREGKEVPDDEIVRGYESERGRYTLVEKEEIEGARKASAEDVEAHVLEVLQFVSADALDPVSFAHPYHLAPDEGGRKSFAVLQAALKAAGRIGLGRLRLRGALRLAALLPHGKGIDLIVLRPFEEIAAAPSTPLPAPQAAETKMARLLIDEMSADGLDPARYPDRYRAALKKLLASHRPEAGARAAREGAARSEGGEVVDLMSALKASLARRGGRGKSGRPRAA